MVDCILLLSYNILLASPILGQSTRTANGEGEAKEVCRLRFQDTPTRTYNWLMCRWWWGGLLSFFLADYFTALLMYLLLLWPVAIQFLFLPLTVLHKQFPFSFLSSCLARAAVEVVQRCTRVGRGWVTAAYFCT